MKAIMISIKPQWVAKILNGEKTIEIRKKFPKDYVGWVYIYCTKDKKYGYMYNGQSISQGVVVARFWCDEIEYIEDGDFKNFNYISYCLDSFRNTISAFSCLSIEQINAYLKGKDGYAIHIGKLEIFDKPKELSEFNALQRAKATDCGYLKQCKNCGKRFNRCHLLKPLTKAPQSWQYIETDSRV